MNRSRRVAISALSIVWIVGIGLLTAWHQIWAPYLSSLAKSRPRHTPLPEPKVIQGSFRDEFDEHPDPYGSPVTLDHPVHGALGLSIAWSHTQGGMATLKAGALMMHTDPVADCTTALSFGQEGGADPAVPALVVLFARCQDSGEPYRTGYAYEWDMRERKERIWAAGQLLVERPRPGDGQLHTMSFVANGSSLTGRIDGGAALQAEDTRFTAGSVGFGAHGDPRIVCDWYELKRPGAEEPTVAQAIDVGAPFAVRELFQLSGEAAKENAAVFTTDGAILSATDYGPHGPWYTISRTGMGGMLTMHGPSDGAPGNPVAFVQTALCLIASKGATSSVVRAQQAGSMARMYPDMKYQPSAAEAAPGTSLMVRMQEPEQAWAGCYSLTYDCEQQSIELRRYDKAGPPRPAMWLEPFPVKSTVLDSVRLAGVPTDAIMWISAEGSKIEGGTGDSARVSAVDATYPSGYVGYGAPPGAYGTFRWVEMKGRPG